MATRPTIFDFIQNGMTDENENKYCKRSDLVNEAGVEQFFIIRLLEDLEYKDKEIKPKESISELTIH
jgi:type I restriction enzyme M protein